MFKKDNPRESAMGMLAFYVNRADNNLGKERRRLLEHAKDELRALFDKN